MFDNPIASIFNQDSKEDQAQCFNRTFNVRTDKVSYGVPWPQKNNNKKLLGIIFSIFLNFLEDKSNTIKTKFMMN